MIEKLNECIIIASKFKDDHIILAKNRDRTYVPKIEIIKDYKDDIELAYIYDSDTGWAEGLAYNHKTKETIGIVNTALMVGHDEKEKKLVKKSGVKSKDGIKIIKALETGNLKDALEIIKNYESGVKGHTFIVSSTGKGYKLEQSTNMESFIDELALDSVTVRTNHGFANPESGYTTGEDYLSSRYRKMQAQKVLDTKNKDEYSAEDIISKLKKKNYDYDSTYNMNRDTEKMKTTGQLALDLTANILYYDFMNKKSEVLYILNRIPDEIKSKIKVKVIGDEDDKVEVIKESKLFEMPYINYGSNNNEKTFDLELENYKTEKDIYKLFDNILSGKPIIDKYGDKIQLKSRQEKIDFITALSWNDDFNVILNKRFKLSFDELLDSLINKYMK